MNYKSKDLGIVSKVFLYTISLAIIILFYTYFSFKSEPYGSDHGRIINSSLLLLKEGATYVINIMMPQASSTLYSILTLIWGRNTNLIGLSGFISSISLITIARLTRKRGQYSIILIFALSSPLFFQQAIDLRPYALTCFILILSLYFLKGGLLDNNKTKLTISAGLLGTVVYFQNLFLVAIAIPGIYFIVSGEVNDKKSFIRFLLYYLVIGIFISIWFIPRFSTAGLEFYRAPYTWMYSEGYWQLINTDLLNRPEPYTLDYYSYFLSKLLNDVIHFKLILIFLVIGVLSSLKEKRTLLLLSWIIAFSLPVLLGKIPTESRYLYPIIFPLAIYFVDGVNKLKRIEKKPFFLLVMLLVSLNACLLATEQIDQFYRNQQHHEDYREEFREIKNTIDGPGNIYFRSHTPATIFKERRVYSITDLPQASAIDLITWKNESRVAQSLEKHDIAWIILYSKKSQLWEKEFHSWVKIATGDPPKHYLRIRESPKFIKEHETENFVLYHRVSD